MSGVIAGRAFVDVGIRSEVEKDLLRLGNSFSRFGERVARIGAGITALGGAIFAPFAASAGIFANIDDEIRLAASIAGATSEQFTELTNVVRELGATTSFTASQVAQGATILARAGFDVPEIGTTLPQVLNLARSASTDLATAGQIAANTLRAFQLPVADLESVVDSLLVTVNSSTQDINDLGEALKFIGIDAATAGVSLNDVNAALGILANLGLRGSLAGTSIRRVLLNLSDPQIREQLEFEFGVIVDDDALQDFSGTLASILQQAQGLSNIDRQSLFFQLFDARAKGAALAIAEFSDELVNFTIDLENSGGTAATVSRELDAGLGGSFRLLRSAVEGLALALGDAILGDLIGIVDAITRLTLIVRDFVSQNETLVRNIAALGATVVGVGASLTAFGLAFVGLGTAINLGTTAFGALIPFLTNLGIILEAIAPLFVTVSGSLFGGFAVAANPIGIVTAAILGLISAIGVLTSDGRALLSSLASAISDQFGIILTTIRGIFEAVTTGNFTTAFDIALTGIRLLYLDFFALVLNEWGGWLDDLIGALQQAFFGVLNIIGNIVRGIVNLFRNVGSLITQILTGDISGAFEEIFRNAFNIKIDLDKGFVNEVNRARNETEENLNALLETLRRDTTADGLNNISNDINEAAGRLDESTKNLNAEQNRQDAAAREAADAELAEATKRAEQLTDQFASPLENFVSAFNEADNLLNRELISRQTALESVAEAARDLGDASGFQELRRQLDELVSAGRLGQGNAAEILERAVQERANQFNQNFTTPLDDFINTFNEADQFLQLGLTDRATAFQAINQAARNLASEEGIEGLRNALNGLLQDGQLELSDAQNIFRESLRDRADAVIESIETPEQALQAAVDELVLLRDQGLVDPTQFEAAARNATEEYVNATNNAARQIAESFDVRSFTNSFSALRGNFVFAEGSSNREDDIANNTELTATILQQILDNGGTIVFGP